MTRYLTLQEVRYVHQRTLERTGGASGIRDHSLLEATLNRPRAMLGGNEVYPTVAQKGAVLAYSLVLNHLFVDGNKRLGLQCLDVFLKLNELRLTADVTERYQFLMDVANESLGIPEIAAWIEQHSEPRDVAPKATRRPRQAAPTTRRVTIRRPKAAGGDEAPSS